MNINDIIAEKRKNVEDIETKIAQLNRKLSFSTLSEEKKKIMEEITKLEKQKRESEYELQKLQNERLNELAEQLRKRREQEKQEERLSTVLPLVEEFTLRVCFKCTEKTNCEAFLTKNRQKMLPCILSELLNH